MMQTRFHHLFVRICIEAVIFVAIIIIPYQAIAATRYVATGGNCGVASPCYTTIQGCRYRFGQR